MKVTDAPPITPPSFRIFPFTTTSRSSGAVDQTRAWIVRPASSCDFTGMSLWPGPGAPQLPGCAVPPPVASGTAHPLPAAASRAGLSGSFEPARPSGAAPTVAGPSAAAPAPVWMRHRRQGPPGVSGCRRESRVRRGALGRGRPPAGGNCRFHRGRPRCVH